VLPDMIILECDYGAEWPTWVPAAHEPVESGRTDYLPLDGVRLTASLRKGLHDWQTWWERIEPQDEAATVDPGEWRRFIAAGRSLVEALQAELGDAVDVRLGFQSE
jgi:hypothetical protein